MAAAHRLDVADTRIEPPVWSAVTGWVWALYDALTGESLTAASRARNRQRRQTARNMAHGRTVPPVPDPPTEQAVRSATAAAEAAYRQWVADVDNNVLPAVSIVFGEAFQSLRRTTPEFRAQQEYMATVSDRLRIWPEGAFEELRPELLEALSEAETIEQITDRVGHVLGIDADTRDIRARIGDIDPLAEDLRQERRNLWAAHDEAMQSWRWKARRIARTESHGAVNAGQLAGAAEMEAETGETYHKRWISTTDTRTRAAHRVADGQTVPLSGKFRVGGWLLDFPGDPVGPGHVSINCRCAMVFYSPDAVQDALQGPDASLGDIRPGGVRLGTDDPDKAADAIREVAEAEQRALPPDPDVRGEDHGQPAPPATPEVELTDERESPTVPPVTDLTEYSDDELLALLMDANRQDDDELYQAAMAEYDKRTDRPRPDTPPSDEQRPAVLPDDDAPDDDSGYRELLDALDDDDISAMIDDARADGDDDLLRVLVAERDRRRGLTSGGLRNYHAVCASIHSRISARR